jgi:hypothetical protein
MGDGLAVASRDNRLCQQFSDLGGTKVLEWKPRFAAILVVLTLIVTAALASGYVEWLVDNWEW